MNEIVQNCGKGMLENLSLIANISVPIIAVGALIVALFQIKSNAAVQRRAVAYNLYHQFLSLAMENHEFAYGRKEEIEKISGGNAKYRWFVSVMLLCFEEILVSCPSEEDWLATINSQLERHAWHLATSSSVRKQHWKGPLNRMIHAHIANFAKRDVIKDPGEICFKLSQ